MSSSDPKEEIVPGWHIYVQVTLMALGGILLITSFVLFVTSAKRVSNYRVKRSYLKSKEWKTPLLVLAISLLLGAGGGMWFEASRTTTEEKKDWTIYVQVTLLIVSFILFVTMAVLFAKYHQKNAILSAEHAVAAKKTGSAFGHGSAYDLNSYFLPEVLLFLALISADCGGVWLGADTFYSKRKKALSL